MVENTILKQSLQKVSLLDFSSLAVAYLVSTAELNHGLVSCSDFVVPCVDCSSLFEVCGASLDLVYWEVLVDNVGH